MDGSGTVACFVTPSEKSAYGRFIRSATIRETPSICASSSASTRTASPATFATILTVRSSCVGPNPPEVATRSADATASATAASSSAGSSPTTWILGRLDPEREQRPRQERPVQIGALAAHELAARDDDDRAWPPAVRARQAASAAKIFFAVTKTPCALTAAGSRTRLPLRRTSTFCGDSSRHPEHLAVEPLLLAALERPLVEDLAESAALLHEQVGVPARRPQLEPRRPGRLRRLHRRTLLGGGRLQPVHGLVLRAAEAPRHDHERCHDRDRGQGEDDDARLAPIPAPRSRGGHAPGADGRLLLADHEAGVVLVDVELAVEAEVVGIGAQEAFDVGVRGQQLEALFLECAQVLPPDLRPVLGVRELDVAAEAGLAQAVADLEHWGMVAAVSAGA